MKSLKPIQKSNIFFLILLLMFTVGSVLLSLILRPLNLSAPVTIIVTHVIILIIPAILYILITKQKFKTVLRLNRIGIKSILIAVLIGIIAQPVMFFLSYIASLFFTNDVSVMLDSLSSQPLWLMILMIGVTPAISEEITMRGIVLSGYKFKNKHIAAVMSGLMFGILHLNPHQFLYAFAMGVIFAYIVMAANSIYVGMIAHFTINTSQLLLQRAITSISEKLSSVMNNVDGFDASEAMNLFQSMSITEKISGLIFYGVIAFVGALILRALIQALGNIRLKETRYALEASSSTGVVSLEEIENTFNDANFSYYQKRNISIDELKNEKLIGIPFILSIIIYIIAMYMSYFRI